jgi:uncharacterized membrane protein required for colicin V production
MLDFVLGAALAGLAVRGWIRGFVREILDLVGLVLGIWVAFTLSQPLGSMSHPMWPVLARESSYSSSSVLRLALVPISCRK